MNVDQMLSRLKQLGKTFEDKELVNMRELKWVLEPLAELPDRPEEGEKICSCCGQTFHPNYPLLFCRNCGSNFKSPPDQPKFGDLVKHLHALDLYGFVLRELKDEIQVLTNNRMNQFKITTWSRCHCKIITKYSDTYVLNELFDKLTGV